MSHCSSLTGGTSRFLGGARYLSGRSMGGKGDSAGLSHRDLTSRPGARLFDRKTRAEVTGLRFLKEVQYVLRASGRPHSKAVMICVLQDATATQGNEPGVPVLAEYDLSFHFLPSALEGVLVDVTLLVDSLENAFSLHIVRLPQAFNPPVAVLS